MAKNFTTKEIKSALGPLSGALVFRYDTKLWNRKSFMGHRLQNIDADTVRALEFEAVGNKDLAATGYRVAFIAICPINIKQYQQSQGYGECVENPQFDFNGTAVVGTIGVMDANGNLVKIDPNNGWFAHKFASASSTIPQCAGRNFAKDIAMDTMYRKNILRKYLERGSK